MIRKLATLICESEVLIKISDHPSEKEIKDIFLYPSLNTLTQDLSVEIHKAINNYGMDKPHFYRIKLQVHAQEDALNLPG